uniref:BHLH domain-containing protein n=1 Tax=Triticum urartu TaxID=4572 RepID=A0A8R7QN49_TRIUA
MGGSSEPESHGTSDCPRGGGGSSSKCTRAAEVHNLSERVVARFPVVNHFPLSFTPLFCSSRPIFLADHCLLACLIGVKRRRSRIDEKMKALQILIPNSNKVGTTKPSTVPLCFSLSLNSGLLSLVVLVWLQTDKASMLDEAILIEYLKQLRLQVHDNEMLKRQSESMTLQCSCTVPLNITQE